MQPDDRNAALLWDMKQAACEIMEMIQGVSYGEFKSKKVIRYAVERQVLIIGEAAKRVSQNF